MSENMKKNILICFLVLIIIGLSIIILKEYTDDKKIEMNVVNSKNNLNEEKNIENNDSKENENIEKELTISPNENYNLLAKYQNEIVVNNIKYIITNYFYYKENEESTSNIDKYYLYREAYINNKRVIELSRFGYPSETNTKEEVQKYIDNQKLYTIKDKVNNKEYLAVEFAMHDTSDSIHLSIYNSNIIELSKISVSYGFAPNYLIFKDINDATTSGGYDNYDASTSEYFAYYKRLAYIKDNSINYIKVNADNCDFIEQYTLTISNGKVLNELNKTYSDKNIFIGDQNCN